MNWRKWIAIVMMPVMLVCLAGFGWGRQNKETVQRTEEEVLKIALQQLEEAESMHSRLVMDMDVKVFRLKTGVEASMDMVSFRDPVKVKSEINLDMGLLGSTGLEVYAGEQNDAYQLFVKNGDGWKAKEVEASQIGKYDGLQLMQVYLEQIVDMEAEGTEVLDGRKAYKYTGIVQSEGLKKMLVDTGSLQVLSALFQDSILKSLGAFLQKEEEIGMLLATAQDLELTLWVDAQTGYPLQCKMDITDMMKDAYELMFTKVASGSGKMEQNIWSQLEVTKTEIVICCSDFNAAEDFAIPKAALKTKL